MLKDSELGKDLWGEAISTHVYIHNRCPSSILPNNVTPYEKVFGHAPSISHLQVFGSKCFVKIPDETRSKLEDKAKECRLLGFEGDSLYVVVDADRKKLRSRNVIFMEGKGNRNDAPSLVEISSPMATSVDSTPGASEAKTTTSGGGGPGQKFGALTLQGDPDVS